MNPEDQNQEKNKLYYEKLCSNYDIKNILHWINNLDKFIDSAGFGANVFTNYNAIVSGEIVRKLNENNTFKHSIFFLEGGFLENNLTPPTFAFVQGKEFQMNNTKFDIIFL